LKSFAEREIDKLLALHKLSKQGQKGAQLGQHAHRSYRTILIAIILFSRLTKKKSENNFISA